MRQNLERRWREYADEINCQSVDVQNMHAEVQRDADRVAARESALEVRREASEERKERMRRFWESRENALGGRMLWKENAWSWKSSGERRRES